MRTRSSRVDAMDFKSVTRPIISKFGEENSNDAVVSNSPLDVNDDVEDAPIATSFKQQADQRVRAEKAAKTSAQLTKRQEKVKRKTKTELTLVTEIQRQASKSVVKLDIEEIVDLPKNDSVPVRDGAELSDDKNVVGPARRKRTKKVLKQQANVDEFKMTDTFDFRQYLPKNILEDVDQEGDDDILGGDEVDSEEEELTNALMEDGYSEDDSGDSDDANITPKKPKLSRQDVKKKDKESDGASKSSRPRRNSRHFRKKYSAAPRVIILSRQNTAEQVRARADAYIKERLFGATESRAFRGPRRMNQEAIKSLAAKMRVRRVGLKM